MDPESAVLLGILCMGAGFAIRFFAEAGTWGKELTSEQLKSRIRIGYGALIGGIVIGVMLIQSAIG